MKINSFVPDTKIFNAQKDDNKKVENSNGASFINDLKKSLDNVNEKQVESDVLTEKLVRGDENVDIHQVMLSTEEAKMSLQLAVQVRNKLLDAYQELSRMQL